MRRWCDTYNEARFHVARLPFTTFGLQQTCHKMHRLARLATDSAHLARTAQPGGKSPTEVRHLCDCGVTVKSISAEDEAQRTAHVSAKGGLVSSP
jgi:hypothetical protein